MRKRAGRGHALLGERDCRRLDRTDPDPDPIGKHRLPCISVERRHRMAPRSQGIPGRRDRGPPPWRADSSSWPACSSSPNWGRATRDPLGLAEERNHRPFGIKSFIFSRTGSGTTARIAISRTTECTGTSARRCPGCPLPGRQCGNCRRHISAARGRYREGPRGR